MKESDIIMLNLFLGLLVKIRNKENWVICLYVCLIELVVFECSDNGQSKTAIVTFKDPKAHEIALLLSVGSLCFYYYYYDCLILPCIF